LVLQRRATKSLTKADIRSYRIERRGESMRKRGMVNSEEVTQPMTTSAA
jgi:hypothetical protein